MDFQTFLTTVGGVCDNPFVDGSSTPETVDLSADFPDAIGTEYLKIADDTRIDPGFTHVDGDFTITGFIYPEFMTEAGITKGVFSKGLSTDETDIEFHVLADSTGTNVGRVRFFCSDGTTVFAVSSSAGSIANNAWVFFEVTYDGSTKILSLNLDRGTPVTASSVEPVQGLTAEVRVGGPLSVGIEAFEGQISCLGLWDRILTSDELNEVYNAGQGVLFADLTTPDDAIIYAELDEVSGTRTLQGSEGGDAGPLQENATVPSSSNVPS